MKHTYKNIFISCTIGAFVIGMNFWHVITQWLNNPSERFYIWIAHYYADYFLYVSQIAQGVRGNWIFSRAMYTNEFIPDTWVYWPNVLIGKVGSIVNTSPFILYSLSLLIFVVLLLFLIYTLTRHVFPTQPHIQLLAFLFCATASNFPNINALITRNEFSLMHEMWFSPTPALNRFGGVPHQTLQTILLLCSILLCTKLFIYPQRVKLFTIYCLLFAVACFLTATISPIQMLILYVSIAGSLIILKPNRLTTISLAIGGLSATLGAYMVNHAFDASILYTFAKNWEASQPVTTSLPTLFLAMGPISLMMPFGIKGFLKKHTPLTLILFLYGGLSVALFISPIPHFLHTSPVRWIHPASFSIWYCLSALGVYELSSRVHQSRALSSLIILLYLILTFPALIAQVDIRSSKKTASILYSDVNHVPTLVISTLTTHRLTDVVLTDPTLPYDALVPILTGKRSFTGHPVHTLYPQVKEQLRWQFFTGSMKENVAKQFLTDHSIGSIIVSTLSKHTLSSYSFLTASYSNEAIIIYETKK